MQISITDLRQISDVLFAHLEKRGRQTIDISQDYYWFVSVAHRYHPYQEPTALRLGQLTDDWKQLQKILSSESEATSDAFVRLASLLRAIGDTLS